MTAQPIVKMRKKPKQARAEATIAAIVEAAAQVLQQEGEDALTTARIAERAGVSIGSVYQYFPNKDAILFALIRKEREAIFAEVSKRIGAIKPGNDEDMVREVVATLVAAFRPRRKRRKLVALTVAVSADRDDTARELRDGVGDLILEVSRRNPSLSSRTLTKVSAYVVTRAVLGVIRSAVVENAKILDDPAFEEELSRLAIAYLKA